MKDKQVLESIYARLHQVHGEREDYDYMRRLAAIIKIYPLENNTKDNLRTCLTQATQKEWNEASRKATKKFVAHEEDQTAKQDGKVHLAFCELVTMGNMAECTCDVPTHGIDPSEEPPILLGKLPEAHADLEDRVTKVEKYIQDLAEKVLELALIATKT